MKMMEIQVFLMREDFPLCLSACGHEDWSETDPHWILQADHELLALTWTNKITQSLYKPYTETQRNGFINITSLTKWSQYGNYVGEITQTIFKMNASSNAT